MPCRESFGQGAQEYAAQAELWREDLCRKKFFDVKNFLIALFACYDMTGKSLKVKLG